MNNKESEDREKRLLKHEQEYMNILIRDLDENGALDVLGSSTSVTELGEMYFMLQARETKRETQEPGNIRPTSIPEENDRSPVKDLITVIKENDKIVLTGDPGAGKTTSLLYIATLLLAQFIKESKNIKNPPIINHFENVLKDKPFDSVKYIPVYINLKTSVDDIFKKDSLSELIHKKVKGKHSQADTQVLVQKWEDDGRLWLLLDGLDELSGDERSKFLNLFHDYYKCAPKGKITLSSRPAGKPYSGICISENAADNWKLHPYQLLPLENDAASIAFASLWLKKLSVSGPEEQAVNLINCPQVKGIMQALRNPMLLRMLIYIYKNDGCSPENLPASRMELYERYIKEVMLIKFPSIKDDNKDDEGEYSTMMDMLEHLAWIMHSKNEPIYTESQFKKIDSYFSVGKDRNYWFHAFTQMRILFEFANDDITKHCIFSHRSYQEYFVARRLLSLYRENKRGQRWVMNKIINRCVYSSHYLQVVLMFLKKISLEIPKDKRYGEVKKLYGKLPKYHIVKVKELFDERILEPGEALEKEKDKECRIEAIKSLGDSRDNSSVDKLITTLIEDGNEGFRFGAARALGEIGGEDAVKALIAALKEDGDVSVRGEAAEALGKIGREAALDALITALKEDGDPGIRFGVAWTLVKIGGEAAVKALFTALKEDSDTHVRGEAARTLGEIGGEAAVKTLFTALKEDGNAGVRGEAARALGEIGGEAAVKALFTALKEDGNAGVRKAAAEALGEIGGEAAVKALITALKDKDDNTHVRGWAAWALGKIGGEAAVKALFTALKEDSDTHVRGWAAEALGRIGGEAALDALITILKDKDDNTYVRGWAAKALGKIGGEDAVKALIASLKDKVWYVSEVAENALRGIGIEQEILEALKKKPKNKRLQKLAIDIYKKKNTLPELPEPKLPGLTQDERKKIISSFLKWLIDNIAIVISEILLIIAWFFRDQVDQTTLCSSFFKPVCTLVESNPEILPLGIIILPIIVGIIKKLTSKLWK
jgi:HEAT repeat protein/energy-coupling factor transporter ATP-binding protein EcfA2